MPPTPKLRILPFIHSFEPGGVERVALRLAAAWHAAGHDVPVLLGRVAGAMAAEAPPLDYVAPRGGARWTGPFETLWMIGRLRRAVPRLRPDILFCAGNTYAVVAVAVKLLLGRRCPPIVAKISNDLERSDFPFPLRLAYRLWLRVQGRFIDHFVGMAEPMRQEIIDATGVGSERVSIIENPSLEQAEFEALTASRRRRTASPAGRRFIAVGRLARQKNLPLLLRAFAAGAGEEDRLVLLGDGPERRRLRALADRLGLSGRLIMPGHCADTADWFARSDILLLSSDYEGLPGVVVEALAAGLAIVATDCCSSLEMLLDGGRLGRIVPRGDVVALARAIAEAPRWTADPAAAERQAARFTVARAAPAYVALMRRLMAGAAGKVSILGGAEA